MKRKVARDPAACREHPAYPWRDCPLCCPDEFMLEALEEVDRIGNQAPPVAPPRPPPLTPAQLEEMRGLQNAAATVSSSVGLSNVAGGYSGPMFPAKAPPVRRPATEMERDRHGTFYGAVYATGSLLADLNGQPPPSSVATGVVGCQPWCGLPWSDPRVPIGVWRGAYEWSKPAYCCPQPALPPVLAPAQMEAMADNRSALVPRPAPAMHQRGRECRPDQVDDRTLNEMEKLMKRFGR